MQQKAERQREVSAAASLDGPIAKLDRAKAHLKALNKSVGAYKRSKTHDFIVTELDPKTREKVVHLEILKEPKNPEWGLLLGDMAHNLRSALDHLVWQLVLLNGEKPRRQNQFPVIATEAEYWKVPADRSESVRDRALFGVAEEHRTFIDAVQPFNAGDDPQTALVHLSWFSNTDKHRVIHGAFVVTSEPSPERFDVTTPHPGGAALEFTMNWGALDDGAEIMRFRPNPPGAHVDVKAEIPVYITFGDRSRRFNQDQIIIIFKWIDAYVRGFEPIFRGELAMGKGSPFKRIDRS